MAHGSIRPSASEATMPKRVFFLLVTVVGLAAVALKRQRSRELDEAMWEEPSDL